MCQIRCQIAKYLDHALAYVNHAQIMNPNTGAKEHPDEKFMLDWEDTIDISETAADDFRRSLAAYVGHRCLEWDKIRKGDEPPFPPWDFTAPPQVIRMAHAVVAGASGFQELGAAVLGWNDQIVPRLANVIMQGPTWQDGPVLADALEEAGCFDEPLLLHLREETPKTDSGWCLAVSLCQRAQAEVA